MDVLEAAPTLFSDVVILQTVAAEIRHRNLPLFSRLSVLLRNATESRRFMAFANEHHRDTFISREDSESSNDYNDRAIRVAALWLHKHVEPMGLRVLLLTNDTANKKFAGDEGLPCLSMSQFVAKNAGRHPGLSELLCHPSSDDLAIPEPSDHSSASQIYSTYLPEVALSSALKAQRVFQGTLRVSKECWFEARVAIHNTGGQASSESTKTTGGDDMVSVLISGRDAINRAMEGDTVVIELLSRSQWRQPSAKLVVRALSAAEDAEISSSNYSLVRPPAPTWCG
jgi:exosome complex exonuclease DIS3/RRP44